jgi:hypothetical protein
MKNLAGNHDADRFIKEELFLAGIDTVNIGGNINGEVPYSIIGRLGKWYFYRAWYYWIARVENCKDGLPLDIAVELHERKHPTDKTKILGQSIRSGGHAGAPSPAEYGAQPIYDEELNEQLIKLGYKKEYSTILEMDYIPISVGEVSQLCNEGKLIVKRYVNCYHIDDQIGLNAFAETIMKL